MGNKSNSNVVQKQRRSMTEQLAMYGQIITTLGVVMILWQLEKAGRLLQMMSKFLAEAVEEHDKN
tara:strand:+ start:162 stop:356 length:195 start_codon:yes stop_codon:yes gene_type:complete